MDTGSANRLDRLPKKHIVTDHAIPKTTRGGIKHSALCGTTETGRPVMVSVYIWRYKNIDRGWVQLLTNEASHLQNRTRGMVISTVEKRPANVEWDSGWGQFTFQCSLPVTRLEGAYTTNKLWHYYVQYMWRKKYKNTHDWKEKRAHVVVCIVWPTLRHDSAHPQTG